jgi:excisionase family DNA binding protein
MNTIKVYTLEEVAEILQLTRRTLYTYIKNGQLKAVKIGKYWRVSEETLQQFIATGTETHEDEDAWDDEDEYPPKSLGEIVRRQMAKDMPPFMAEELLKKK